MTFVCIFTMMGLGASKAIVEVMQVGDIGLRLYQLLVRLREGL